jgi:hypothetical protein
MGTMPDKGRQESFRNRRAGAAQSTSQMVVLLLGAVSSRLAGESARLDAHCFVGFEEHGLFAEELFEVVLELQRGAHVKVVVRVEIGDLAVGGADAQQDGDFARMLAEDFADALEFSGVGGGGNHDAHFARP